MSSKEVFFDADDIIVSKTNLKGHLDYVNDVFCTISGYTEPELLGQPHSIIRNHKMPRCIFKLLWDRIAQKREVFAYVVNDCKNGDYYWVLAHVTPSLNTAGEIVGYHSNRRVPCPTVIKDKIIPLYDKLLQIEQSTSDRKQGLLDSSAHVEQMLAEVNLSYDEFVFSLDPK